MDVKMITENDQVISDGVGHKAVLNCTRVIAAVCTLDVSNGQAAGVRQTAVGVRRCAAAAAAAFQSIPGRRFRVERPVPRRHAGAHRVAQELDVRLPRLRHLPAERADGRSGR